MSILIYGTLIPTPNEEVRPIFNEFLIKFAKLVDEFENISVNIKPFRKQVEADDEQTINFLAYSINYILSHKEDFEPIIQFAAMRILKSIMEVFSDSFQYQVEKVMIEALYKIAIFKKESSNEQRGTTYFCNERILNQNLQFIGYHLHKLVLESIQAWASWFKDSKFETLFKTLKNEGVTFPQNFIYFRPALLGYSIQAIKDEQFKVIQKYDPAAAASVSIKDKEKEGNIAEEKIEKKEKGDKLEKVEKTDKNEKADKLEKQDKQEKVEKLGEKWEQQIMEIPEDKKTIVQKLQDKINKQNEDKWSYKMLRSRWGKEKMEYSDYSDYEYQFEKRDFYKKFQYVKHCQKLVEQGFCLEPYNYVNLPMRILVYRTILNSYDIDYINLFDDMIASRTIPLFEYQQNTYKDCLDKGLLKLRFMRPTQTYSSNFYIELGNVLAIYSGVITEAKYSKLFVAKMNQLKEANSLYNVTMSEANYIYYRKRYQEIMDGKQKIQQDLISNCFNMLTIEECYKIDSTLFKFKRKMQILQNKFVAFQYYEIPMTSKAQEYFKVKNFSLAKWKKHIIYFKVSDINEAFKVLEEKEKQHFPLYDKELRFVLSKVQVQYPEKYENTKILLSRMSFKNCSTALISNFMIKNCQEVNQLPKSVEIINCSISDSELTEITKHIDLIRNKNLQPNQYPAINMKWLIEGCKYISYSYLENFNHSVEKWNVLQEHYHGGNKNQFYKDAIDKIRLNIAIKNSSSFKCEDFLKLSTFESIRGSRGIKLKKLEGENMDQVMGYMLSSRLVYTQEEELSNYKNYQCILKGISFDSSVCKSFDDLTLYEEYFCSMQKVRFKCTSPVKQEITFAKMRAYSLNDLQVIKLKNCILPKEFFVHFQKMQCIQKIKLINFKNSQFNSKDLQMFLTTSQLTSLEDVDLSYTSIDDDVCYALHNVFCNLDKLKVVDISNNTTKKLTHKGIKYLTYITSLEILNISNCSHAVDDTLSPYFVDFLRRKNNVLKTEYCNVVKKYIANIISYKEKEFQTCDQQIKNLKKDQNEVEAVLDQIHKINLQLRQKVDNYDYEDYYNPNDENLYYLMRENLFKEYHSYIKEAISVMQVRDATFEEVNKSINDKLKELEEKRNKPSVTCLIESIDLSGNKHITSIFFEEFTKTNYIEKLFYLNLSKTSVCGEIFTYLQKFDSQKLIKGQSLYKNNSFLKQGTLEEEFDAPLQKITEEKIGSMVSNKGGKDEVINKVQVINLEEDKKEGQEDGEKKDQEGKVNQSAMGSPRNGQNNQQEFIKDMDVNKKIDRQSITNTSQVFKTVNAYLEVLILASCKNIKASKFLNLFSTMFINLHELNLHDCAYFDLEFEYFINNKSKCFNKLKTINLQYSNITNESIWKFLIQDQTLLEIYIDYTNFSQNPVLANHSTPNQQSQQKARLKMSEIKNNQHNQTKEEKPLLPNVFLFSTIGCKLYNDKNLLEILEQIKSNIFDFNYFLSNYRHLITKRLVYYLVKDYQQMKKYFYLNISGASLPDIEESEKYQEEVLHFYQRVFKNFQKNNQTQQTTKTNSFLESFVFDNSRINYKLFTKIIKYHPTVKYVSCTNTPYLFPISVEHKKKNSEDLLTIDQLMHLINQKNIQLSERNMEEILSQIQKIRQGEKKNKSRRLHKLNLNGNQQLSAQNLDQLISSLFSYLNAFHLQYTRVDSSTILQIIEKGQNIEQINLKGCIHISKEVLVAICKSKNLSKNFRLECILEQKHLIDYEVLTCLAQSKYMTNILYLDLSDISVPNMDDCIMSICFIAQDISINLRIINLENTQISDRGFQMISVSQKFRNLERIYFKNCPLITERGISFIVDSNNLTRFDLSHFLNQDSGLLNGRIVDTLKYSNRKVFFREIDFKQSSISDKELQKLLNETLSNTFSVKMFDLRFTPNLTRESIKSIYSIYQRGTRKKLASNTQNDEESEKKISKLQIVLFDEKRNQPILNNGVNYIDIFTKIIDLQDPNAEITQQAIVKQAINSSSKQNNPSTPQAVGKGANNTNNNSNAQKSGFAGPAVGVSQVQKKAVNQIKQTYEESEINKWKECILRDNADSSQVFEEELKKDMFIVDIFLYHQNLNQFKYDYFLYKHKEFINNNILTAFSLLKFICQKKIYQKNIIDQNNQASDKNNDTESSTLLDSLSLLSRLNSSYFLFLDFSYNKSLTETSLCRFFLNCQILISVKEINLSGTNVNEKVIDSMLASKYLTSLSFIQLDDCAEIKDMNLIIYKIIDEADRQVKATPDKIISFNFKKIFYYYLSYLKDETLSRYLKYFNEKQIKVQCLNLDSSKIDGIFLKYDKCFQKLRLINFSNTYLNLSYLNELATSKNSIKTIWIDRTHTMTDQVVFQQINDGKLTFLTDLPKSENLKKFRIDEFLYSKGPELNKSLSLFMSSILPHFKSDNLNLNYFLQMDPIFLVEILTNQNIIKNFKQISLNFNLPSQIPAFKNVTRLIYSVCGSSDLFCLRMQQISLQYQIDFNKHLEDIQNILDNNKMTKLELLGPIKEKAIIDSKLTRNFPFVPFGKASTIQTFQDYFTYVFEPLQFTEINLSSVLVERKTYRSLMKQLRKGNFLVKLSLRENTQIYDKDIIKYLVNTDNQKQFCFKYLEHLDVFSTNVTQRSLIKILQECPFSRNFNITEFLSNQVLNQIINPTNALNNEAIEYLSESPYLLNIKILDLNLIQITDNLLQRLFYSKYAVNIEKIILNYKYVSNSTFISLASTKKLPLLKSFHVDNDEINCKSHLHYLLRAKNLHLDLDMSSVIFDNNFMFQQENFVMSMIESIYMIQQRSLVMKSIQENIDNINQLFKLSPYLQNIQTINITSLDDRDSFYPVWVNLARTDKLPNLIELSISKVSVEHLKILLVQENKPKLDLSKLLLDNGEVVDNECLQILANQPNLLNMEILDLSSIRIIENKITSSSLLELAMSKYVCNVKRIIIYEDQENVLRSSMPKLDDKVNKKLNKHKKQQEVYEQNGEEMNVNKDEEKKHLTLCAGLYEDMLLYNNFFNLEMVEFKRIECVHPLYVLYTAHRAKKRFYSPKFNLDEFFVQLSNFFFDESINDEQYNKKSNIQLIFKIYYDFDKSWYTKRHKIIKLQLIQQFQQNSITSILQKLENLPLVEEIQMRMTSRGYEMLNFLRSSYLKKQMLNLKKINVDTDYYYSYTFNESYFQIVLRNLKQAIELDNFQFSPFFYKIILPCRQPGQTIQEIYQLVLSNSQAFGFMKDIILYLEELEPSFLNQLFEHQKSFRCRQLILKRHSNSAEAKEESLKTMQDIIINQIVNKRTMQQIRRFKPVQSITWKQFCDLLICDFFHSSVRIFDFFKQHVDTSDKLKPKLAEALLLKQYANYYNLEELVIPNFDSDNLTTDSRLAQFQIHLIQNLKELKIQCPVNIEDLEYLFRVVYPLNKKLNVSISNISDDVFLGLFLPPKMISNQSQDIKARPASSEKIDKVETNEQSQQQTEVPVIINTCQLLDYKNDEKGRDWTEVCRFISSQIEQLDELKQFSIYENINQNSSRYYLSNLGLKQSIILNKELPRLNASKIYLPVISITENKNTAQIVTFMSKVDCLNQMIISKDNDFNFNHLLKIHDQLQSTQIFEQIFEHSSQLITNQDLLTMKESILQNMLYLCFKKNKFILNDKTIETIHYQKKRFFLDESGTQKKTKKKKLAQIQVSQQEIQETQQKEEDDAGDDAAQDEDKQLQDENASDSDSNKDDLEDSLIGKKESAITKGNQQNNLADAEDEQRINDEDLMDQKKWISKENLSLFLQKFKKLKRINFGDTEISAEHFNQLNFNHLPYQLEHIDLDNCKVQNPTIFLTNFLSNFESTKEGKGEPRLQLQRFISQISFSNNFPSNLEFVKELVESNYFKDHVKYLNIFNLIKLHEQNGKELMKILQQILKRGDNKFCITSFLIMLGDIRNKLSDQEFDIISRSYTQIQYLSPFMFNNVNYGFNYIIQHASVSPKSKVMYFLNTNFQKNLSGLSFYEILHLLFDEQQLLSNQIIFEKFSDTVDNELENLEDQIGQLQKILESFMENQIGINNNFYSQLISYMNGFEQVVFQSQPAEVKAKVSHLNSVLVKFEEKYLAIAQIYESMMMNKLNQTQAGTSQYKQSQTKIKVSKIMTQSDGMRGSTLKSSKLAVKNLEERGQSEKKLQQQERQIIQTIQYITQLCLKMRESFDYFELSVLLEFVENLNLGNNTFLNFKGFNNYVKNHISPWLAMNQGIQKLKQPQNLNAKLDLSTQNMKKLVKQSIQDDEDDIENVNKRNNMENLIEADNELDDKIFDHLCFFINKKMKGLRVINLSGVNISDSFAEKFSLILSDEDQLRNLVKIDLTNNKRLTAFGMKYLYSTIVDRIPKGFKLELSSTFSEVQLLKDRVEALEKKLDNLDETKNKSSSAIIKQNQELKAKKKRQSVSAANPKQKSKKQTSQDEEANQGLNNLYQEGSNHQLNDQKAKQNPTNNKPPETAEKKIEDNEMNTLIEKYTVQQVNEKDLSLKILFDEYIIFQEYLKSCSQQVDKYDNVGDTVDLTSFLKNGTNIGLYSAINSFVLKNWRTHYLLIISIGLLLFPLTIFHLIQIMTSRMNMIISTYTFDSYFQWLSRKTYTILVDKKVPSTITSEDFYFDKDVAILDQVISGKDLKISDSGQKMRLKRIQSFLENPSQESLKQIKKGGENESVINILRYFHQIIVINMLVFQIGLAIIYPIVMQFDKTPDNCNESPVLHDLPIYCYLILSAISELFLLMNTERIIGSQKIFTTKSLIVISLLYSSIMAKYDIYTDLTFGLQITMCEKLQSKDLGILCLTLISLNFTISFWTQKECLTQIWRYNKKKSGEIHNTAFINQYTKLALIQEMNAFGTVLDRFSTSSAQEPAIKLKFLQGVLFPQVIISKFTRAFIEDIPQIIILLVYQFRQKNLLGDQFSFLSWQYLRVIISSLLSLNSSLTHAWHAKPSVFKTYMFSEFLNFVLKGQSGYKIDLQYTDFRQSYSFEQIYSKIKTYIHNYPIPSKSQLEFKKRHQVHQAVSQNPSASHVSLESQSQLLDNASQADQSVHITSNHTLRSQAQQSDVLSRRPSLQSIRNNDGLTPEEFWKCIDHQDEQKAAQRQQAILSKMNKNLLPK